MLGSISDVILPSVAVAGGEAHEAVGQLVLVDVAAELTALVRSITHGLVIVANDGLGNQGSEVVVRVPADTLNGEGNVGSTHSVVTDTDVRADEVSLLLGQNVGLTLNSLGGDASKVLLGKLNELLVGDTTRTDENHALGSIVVLDVVYEFGAANVTDVLARAENSTSKGLALESSGVEVVKDNLLNLLLDLLRLAEDHVTLTLDRTLLELGVLEDIGQDVDALGNIGVESLGEVDGVFALPSC